MKIITKCLIVISILVILVSLLIARKCLSPQTALASSTSIQQSESPIIVSTLEERIAKDFSPRFVKVVRCESNLKQFNPDGTTLISPTLDVGLFQINLKAHLRSSQKMGLDIINSLEDNYTYAKHLYDESGEQPWVCAELI